MQSSLESLYSHFLLHREITTDSRRVPPGAIFFALRGDQFNGNDYVLNALQSGASLAVADDSSLKSTTNVMVVEDVLTTLQQIARLHRDKHLVPLVAITGTNGKTTTKELISAVLAAKFRIVSTSGNLNNHIGVPLTLLKITDETQVVVVEMGANHPGDIDQLCRIADPDYGIITNIGKAHLEGFGSYEGVIQTKTEMYRYLGEKNGKVFINEGDPLLMKYAGDLQKIGYGPTATQARLVSMNAAPFAAIEVEFPGNQVVRIDSQLYGEYNGTNMLAAACIGSYFGVPDTAIQQSISGYKPVNNRSQVIKTDRNTLVSDAYNANPSSMELAIRAFAGAEGENKMLILGDMLELGEASEAEHINILQLVEQYAFQFVYLVGPVFCRVNTRRENLCFEDSELARLWLEHHRPEGHTILLKGSRGIRLEKVSEVL